MKFLVENMFVYWIFLLLVAMAGAGAIYIFYLKEALY
jgi:hypothetical protein